MHLLKSLTRKQIDKVTLLPINDPPKPSQHPSLPLHDRGEASAPIRPQIVPERTPDAGTITAPVPATITGVTFSPDSPTKISPLPSPKLTSPPNVSRIPEFSSSDDDIVPPYKPTVRLPTSPEKPDSIAKKTEAIERQQSETKVEVQKEDESLIENETSIIESKNVQARDHRTRNQLGLKGSCSKSGQ